MKTPSIPHRFSFIHGLLCFCMLGAAAGLRGAEPSSGSSPSQTMQEEEEEDAVVLSPFVVDSTRDVGYLANNSLSGSRLNTALRDTAASIAVFTPEFIADLGATDLEDVLKYGNNIEFAANDDDPATNGNSILSSFQPFRVRGLPATRTRNFFPLDIPSNSYNVERYEANRGPNSILFGLGSAGGIINSSTKQARPERSFQEVEFSAGSWDSYR
ncbi:MAG: TonB-dependent receptor plug domain-containing protein, partial [Opitutaceae bacterium]